MKLGKVRVGAIAGIALTVLSEMHDLAGRGKAAQRSQAGLGVGACDGGFVDVVACVDRKVDVVTRGGVGIGVEPARRSIGAGEDGDAERGRVAIGQGARATRVGDLTVWRDKAIVQPAPSRKVINDGAGAEVCRGRDLDLA